MILINQFVRPFLLKRFSCIRSKNISDLRSDAIVHFSPLLHQLAPVSWAVVALSTFRDHLQSALGHFDTGLQSLADGVLVGEHQLVGYWIQWYCQQSLIRRVVKLWKIALILNTLCWRWELMCGFGTVPKSLFNSIPGRRWSKQTSVSRTKTYDKDSWDVHRRVRIQPSRDLWGLIEE